MSIAGPSLFEYGRLLIITPSGRDQPTPLYFCPGLVAWHPLIQLSYSLSKVTSSGRVQIDSTPPFPGLLGNPFKSSLIDGHFLGAGKLLRIGGDGRPFLFMTPKPSPTSSRIPPVNRSIALSRRSITISSGSLNPVSID